MKIKRHHDIYIYMEPNCKMCELATIYFREHGHDALEIDVTKDTGSHNKMVEISGQEETPVIEIDGRAVIGYQPDLFDSILRENETQAMVGDDEEKSIDVDGI